MSPYRMESPWIGTAWHEQVEYPYKITRTSKGYGDEIMGYGKVKQRAMRMAMALQVAEGGEVLVENVETGEVVFFIKED